MIISGSSLSFANHRRLTAAAESGQFGNLLAGAAPTAAGPVAAPVDAAVVDAHRRAGGDDQQR